MVSFRSVELLYHFKSYNCCNVCEVRKVISSTYNSQGNVGQEKAPKTHTAKTVLLNTASLRNLLNVIQRAEMFVVETKQLRLSTVYRTITRLNKVNIYYSFQK